MRYGDPLSGRLSAPNARIWNGTLGSSATIVGSTVEQRLILDRYRPLEEVATGGFGTVVLSWDTRMQRRVAIKRLQLPVDAAGVPQHPPGLAEARTAAMLNHPAIVTVFDFDTDADEAFLVMEYVDGASLADLLGHVNGPLTLDECAAIVESVSAAVGFAHDNGVLHLDIKPENVLINRDGRVKVTDFGMAELSTLSGHRAAWGGTPGYMPIEQLEGERVSERTDEWALAAVSFECLTGLNPYASESFSVADAQLEGPPSVRRFVREYPEALDEVLAVGLGPRPADRFPSVHEFAGELLLLLGDGAAGAQSLAELVDEIALEPDIDDEPSHRVGLWDRLRGRGGMLLLRGIAAGEAAWFAWAGLQAWELPLAPLAGAVVLVTVAAALAPSLGIGLGMAAFASGFAAAGSWPMALGLGVAVVAWWWWVARRSPGAAVMPLTAPLLGMAWLSPAMPLLAGFALPPASAAATALAGGALTMLASAASARTAPYLVVWPRYAFDVWGAQLSAENIAALLRSPSALPALLAWPAAAAVMSWACGRATRPAALLGLFAGSAVLGGGYLLADELARLVGTDTGWGSAPAAIALGASLILGVLVVALGAPVRAEEDRP